MLDTKSQNLYFTATQKDENMNTHQTSPQQRKGPAQVTGYLTPGSAIGLISIDAAETLVGCALM